MKCPYCGSSEIFGWMKKELICLRCGLRWWDNEEVKKKWGGAIL